LVRFFRSKFSAPRNAGEKDCTGRRALPLTKAQHLDPNTGPKRILALDGGGIRGVLTLEYLEAIEALLRQRQNDPDLLLSDYFDLIGGTSTGSIIAAGLACGMPVKDIKKLYTDLGAQVFVPTGLGYVAPKFQAGPLQMALDRALGAETTVDSDKIRTGLMVMTKRLDTGSPWPLTNGGGGRYAAQDGALHLTQVVRASTAAPTYFEPERIKISSRDGSVVDGEFVDGGVSPFNDPSLQLLMISVGTGSYRSSPQSPGLIDRVAAVQGLRALTSLMDDCGRVNLAMLQWLSDCLTPWEVDRAVGDMKLDSQHGPQLATYARYNVLLEQAWLSSTLNVDLSPNALAELRKMDKPGNMKGLADLGRAAAKQQVKPEHFSAAFDLA
jgi:uncharacterized protein